MKSLLATALSLAAAVSVSNAQVPTFAKTVPTYDPILPNANQVDVKLPSAAWYASFVTHVANAWNVNRGGVINFDQPQTAPWPTPAVGTNFIRASYGAAYTQSFGVTVPLVGDISSHAPVVPISHRGDMMTKYPGFMALGFSSTTGPIRQAGLTVLQHPQIPQKVSVTFVNAAPGVPTTYSFLIPAGPSNRDTFCGATSTSAGGILGVRIHAVNALTGGPFRVVIDDLALVTRYPVIIGIPTDPVEPLPVTTVEVTKPRAVAPDAGVVAK